VGVVFKKKNLSHYNNNNNNNLENEIVISEFVFGMVHVQ
jgi:hypothetical protein